MMSGKMKDRIVSFKERCDKVRMFLLTVRILTSDESDRSCPNSDIFRHSDRFAEVDEDHTHQTFTDEPSNMQLFLLLVNL